MEGSLSSYCNLLFHDIEAIEPTDEQASAVDAQVEVNVITCKPGKNKTIAVQSVSHSGSLISTVERTPAPIGQGKRLCSNKPG